MPFDLAQGGPLEFAHGGPAWLEVLAVAVFGLCIGSFLNVCAYRLPLGESIVSPPSRCTKCGRTLSWFDNVPVISWVVLGGRCRTCHAPVSWMYPSVEIITSLVFVLTYLTYGWTLLSLVRVLFACALIVLFITDLQHKILPNSITLPGIVAGFVFSFFLPPGWMSSLIGLIVGGGFLWAMAEAYYRLRGQEGLGMGDVKLLAMIGAFLGWKLVLLTLVFASLTGSLAGGLLIASGRGGMKYALPFGTFLAVGALFAATWGEPIADWYFAFYQS
jgi:leader peptidase (prepilin peptidase)/N-methyltransferase